VADFMGFKNIWAGKIESIKQAGAEAVISFNAQGLPITVKSPSLTPDRIQELQKAHKNNEDVFCAIRPEDILTGQVAENCFQCKIDVIEYQGQHNSVSASLPNKHRVDFKSESHHDVNEAVAINIPPDKIQIFTKGGK
jgi:ABC-type Fe3+/spermidine/putrescine transport system ATPase subunit